MSILDVVCAPSTFAARLFNPLQPLVALVARLYVSWQFLQSGYIKVTNWASTLSLFENEYHTPWLTPHAAAIAGSFRQRFFPSRLVTGFISHLGSVCLF